MKTLEQFKAAYIEILMQPRSSDERKLRKAQKTACKLREAIRWIELGVTEESLRKQMAEVHRRLKVLDERFEPSSEQTAETEYKAWRKKNGYADLKKQIASIMWVLKY